MAMSDTGSSMANWSDDLYHYAASPGLSFGAIEEGVAADSTTTIASAATTPTSPASAGSADGSPTNRAAAGGILGARAAGKPAPAGRKRARASRRAPVTMLNTDAANFRAMVQQLTGIPAPPAGPVISFDAPNNNYGFHHQPPPPASVSFDHLHQQYAGAAAFGYGNTNSLQQSLAGGVFAHGLGSAEDRMLLQSIQAAQMPGGHSSNGYFA